MNKFELAEEKGRALLESYLVLKGVSYNFTTGKYDPYDCETEKSIIEIKVRDINSTTYKDFILEKHKVDEMIRLKGDKQAIYINFFNDNVMACWDISRIVSKYKPQIKSCRATTAVYGGYKPKEVYLIELKDAFIVDLSALNL